MNFRAWCKFAP